MTADVIIAERTAWQTYRAYVWERTSPYRGGKDSFCGDATSRALWRLWKASYEIRREAAKPFYRRSNGIRFGRTG